MRTMLLAVLVSFVSSVPAQAQDPGRARQLVDEGAKAYNAGQNDHALQLAAEAIRLDPRCAEAYMLRALAREVQGLLLPAVQDLTLAIEIAPDLSSAYIYRAGMLLYLDRYRDALADCDAGLRLSEDGRLHAYRGCARINLGEVDEGLADIDKGLQIRGRHRDITRFDGYLAKADWQAMYDEGVQMEKECPDWPMGYYSEVIADVETGNFDRALETTQRLERLTPKPADGQVCRARIHGSPAAGKLYNFENALQCIRQLNPPVATNYMVNAAAHVYYDSGRYAEAIHELETHGRMTNFETLFILAASHFRLGQFPEARKYLTDAARINPYISRHTDRVPEMTAFLKGVDAGVAKERSLKKGEIIDKERELALLSVAELETFVKRFRFEKALDGYKKYRKDLTSPSLCAEADARIAALGGVVAAFKRVRERLNSGGLKDAKMTMAGVEISLTKAVDDETFEFTMARGGGKGAWAALGPEGLFALLDRVSPKPDERLGMGIVAWDLGLQARAMDDLQRAVKADAKLKGRLDAFVSARRGIDVPKGGFVAWQGRYVTSEEKANLEKGLALFQGKWVTKDDYAHLAKGEIQVEEKWVPGDEKTLLSKGYRSYKGTWYTREAYHLLRAKWEEAVEVSTTHYDIRTNQGEDFAQELAVLCEVAYEDYKAFYGGKEPSMGPKERMTLWAFAGYEDYRRHCVEHGSEAELQAAGFAVSNSTVVVGWNKTGDTAEFLATMAHEAAHLYYFRVAAASGAPSWYAEGMATQFEGFRWAGSKYVYDRLSRSRLPFIRRAIEQNRLIPLDQLVAGEALTLINSDTEKALVFYAECWALVYFLTQTDQEEYRAAFRRYRDAVDSGKAAPLSEFFTDLRALDADFVKFIKRM